VRAGSQELVLVCAPAAFSKTALLADSVGRATVRWTRRGNRPVDQAGQPSGGPRRRCPIRPPSLYGGQPRIPATWDAERTRLNG
jgi:hypothetical protein